MRTFTYIPRRGILGNQFTTVNDLRSRLNTAGSGWLRVVLISDADDGTKLVAHVRLCIVVCRAGDQAFLHQRRKRTESKAGLEVRGVSKLGHRTAGRWNAQV